ncbi:uncharacterized protein N7515_009127 [Penicillium bovifimosum]|uniref:Uncharacterized protein n=1 Tax=Penicillium bovifimosum TaxID=126998 RepID=A0A9W9GJ49_9EURO|nr:uncharacterized protein N7515_009127 [Penicillium bovifimosum]KAJ5121166.1 hypothetical protein N7515_009127 [Penicillium bovifimosum]
MENISGHARDDPGSSELERPSIGAQDNRLAKALTSIALSILYLSVIIREIPPHTELPIERKVDLWNNWDFPLTILLASWWPQENGVDSGSQEDPPKVPERRLAA